MKSIIYILLLIACAVSVFISACGQAAVFKVGLDLGCTHIDLDDAIKSATASPGNDEIYLSNFNRVNYPRIAAKINNSDVEIVGGFDTCESPSPTGTTTLDGYGGEARSVLEIRGGGVVRLKRLLIQNGDESSDSDGGGIDYKGHGELILENVTLAHNSAGYGGGIYFRGEPGAAVLTLLDYVIIYSNSAVSNGGGIHLGGRSMMNMAGNNNAVSTNTASGYGGGIYIKAPANADIGASGIFGVDRVFAANQAKFGGAIAVLGDSDGHSNRVRLYSTKLNQPQRIGGNRATDKGGAIYARATVDGGIGPNVFDEVSTPTLCLFETALSENSAPNGAAVYLDNHSEFWSERSYAANYYAMQDSCPRPEGYRGCAGEACNEIVRNYAQTVDGVRTNGAIIEAKLEDTKFVVNSFVASGNQGGALMRLYGRSEDPLESISNPAVKNCLIWGNAFDQYIIDAPATAFRLHQCTISTNYIGSNYALRLHAPSNLTKQLTSITNSIIDQPGKGAVELSGVTNLFDVAHVFSNAPFNAGVLRYVTNRDPGFVDPVTFNFRLRRDSPAADYAPYYNDGISYDVFGNLRNVDLSKPNLSGLRDVGAHEVPFYP